MTFFDPPWKVRGKSLKFAHLQKKQKVNRSWVIDIFRAGKGFSFQPWKPQLWPPWTGKSASPWSSQSSCRWALSQEDLQIYLQILKSFQIKLSGKFLDTSQKSVVILSFSTFYIHIFLWKFKSMYSLEKQN